MLFPPHHAAYCRWFLLLPFPEGPRWKGNFAGLPQSGSEKGYECLCAEIGTVDCPRTFLFHFFLCSKFFSIPTLQKVSNRCENTILEWGKRMQEISMVMAGYGSKMVDDEQHGRNQTWAKRARKHFPLKFAKRLSTPTGPDITGRQSRRRAILAGGGNSEYGYSRSTIFLFSNHRDGKFCSVLFFLFIYSLIFLSVNS